MNFRISRSLPAVLTALAACTSGVTAPQSLGPDVESTLSSAGPALQPNVSRNVAIRRASRAEAVLRNAAGEEIGIARFVEDAQGRVHVSVHAKGLTPGLHGIHLHTTGVCNGSTTPAFSSAGGHFNPTGREHGFHNPNGYHAGDLPNLMVNPAGAGHLSTTADYLNLRALFDADGTALVVHQNEDDLMTNTGPSGPGNSGPRIACGVIQAN